MIIQAPHSELSALHTRAETNTALAAAMKIIPGWKDSQAALKRLQAQARLVPEPATQADVTEQIRAAVIAGQDLPRDLTDTVARVMEGRSGHAHTQDVLQRVANGLAGERDTAIRDGVDKALATLHQQLTKVTDTLPALAVDLAGADSPDAAIDAGKVAQWQAWQKALDRYVLVREAQGHLGRAGAVHDMDSTPRGGRLPYVVLVSNLDELWDDLGDYLARGYKLLRGGNERRLLTPPWPTPIEGTRVVDHHAWATYLASTPKAKAWVPTTVQIRDQLAHLAAVAKASHDGQVRPARKVRGRNQWKSARDWPNSITTTP